MDKQERTGTNEDVASVVLGMDPICPDLAGEPNKQDNNTGKQPNWEVSICDRQSSYAVKAYNLRR